MKASKTVKNEPPFAPDMHSPSACNWSRHYYVNVFVMIHHLRLVVSKSLLILYEVRFFQGISHNYYLIDH